MPSRHVSLRMDQSTYDRLEAESRRRHETVSEVARRLIEEGLRMAKHHGIVFRDGPTGRRAGLAHGPDVWEVISVFPEWDPSWDIRSDEAVGGTSVVPYQIRTAQLYYADYPEEIDERVRRNREAYEAGYAEWLAKQPAAAR